MSEIPEEQNKQTQEEPKTETEHNGIPFAFKWSWRGKTRYADPSRVIRVMRGQLGPEMNTITGRALTEFDEEATDQLCAAIADAVKVPAFNEETGEGITTAEVIEFIIGFYDFLADEKKSTDELPNSPQNTD